MVQSTWLTAAPPTWRTIAASSVPKLASRMNLLEFVDYLLDHAKLADLYRRQGLNPAMVEENEVAIYMVGSTITLDAEIRLLTSQQTQDRIEVQLDGIAYVYVLEVDLAIDLLTPAEAGVVTKLDQANRIVHYALYDA
jgi:hypothetical protein